MERHAILEKKARCRCRSLLQTGSPLFRFAVIVSSSSSSFVVGSPTLRCPIGLQVARTSYPDVSMVMVAPCLLPPTPPGTDKPRLLIILYSGPVSSVLTLVVVAHRGQSAPILVSISRNTRCSLQIIYFRRLSKVMACHLPRDAKGHKRTVASELRSYLCRRRVEPRNPPRTRGRRLPQG